MSIANLQLDGGSTNFITVHYCVHSSCCQCDVVYGTTAREGILELERYRTEVRGGLPRGVHGRSAVQSEVVGLQDCKLRIPIHCSFWQSHTLIWPVLGHVACGPAAPWSRVGPRIGRAHRGWPSCQLALPGRRTTTTC